MYTLTARRLVACLSLLGVCLMPLTTHAQPAAPAAMPHTVLLPLVRGGAQATTPAPGPALPAVQIAFDTSRAAHASVGPEGGSVNATGSDGTRYLLTIPADALDMTETITITPAGTAGSLPLSGGLAGALQVAPAGLTFIGGATLTLVPASSGYGPIAAGFAFDGTGEQFHFTPLGRQPQMQAERPGVTLAVPVARVYGLGGATPDDITRIKAASRQLNPSDSLEDLLAPLVPPDASARAADLFERTVFPQLQAAATNPALADSALSGYDRWYQNIALLSLEQSVNGQIDRANQLVQAIIGRAGDAAAERCYTQKRPEEGFRLLRLLGYARRQSGVAPALANSVRARIQKCLTFKLTVQTRLTETTGNWGWTNVLHADLMLRATNGTRAVGSGALVYDSVTWVGTPIPGCTLSGSGAGSTFDATSGTYGLSFTPVSRTSSAVNVTLRYSPGTPSEHKSIVCAHAPGGEGTTQDWLDYYTQLHAYEREGGGFTARTTIVGAGSFEGWVYNHGGSGRNGALSEVTSIEIKHMPER